jgi:NAD+ synthetase
MKPITNYEEVFNALVKETSKYIIDNNIKAMILGISGGIDSTVCAAICHEVSKQTGIPLIGRSLPTRFNKKGEISTADLVGEAFCTDYKVFSINDVYQEVRDNFVEDDKQTKLADGNIQARLRMMYLYNLASIHKGIVIDTDNLTENNLGYFTIHGDVGDFNPIGGLWKTEVFKLAEWLLSYYSFQLPHNMYEATAEQLEKAGKVFQQGKAIKESLKLKPTAGLGITNNDLEELGAESYEQVDNILQEILAWKNLAKERGDLPESLSEQKEMFLDEQQM